MQRPFFIVGLLLALASTISGQAPTENATVTRQLGVQLGYLGTWAYGEWPLGNQLVARAEAGLDLRMREGGWTTPAAFRFTPVVTAGPRYYYNLVRRARRGRDTYGNAANFVALPVSFETGWVVWSVPEGAVAERAMTVLPTWGLRHGIHRRYSVEAGLGLGYSHRWMPGTAARGNLAIWVPFRIGF
ncbi:hypothetical protein CLV84_3732 [Neolewinella xylanilytica]|uniref:Lipid A 3-O-deacylase PagL n=1 Tax=Neolewinella xylanilytica TaxID=1514080 RepID=A0A2S6I0S8_9BACT|nr:hypothetical protein [Neolewinella xylanilytica]PPK84570.1 hypothetical protein CLV84_3732 [Neolewinella xylanilytica]